MTTIIMEEEMRIKKTRRFLIKCFLVQQMLGRTNTFLHTYKNLGLQIYYIPHNTILAK